MATIKTVLDKRHIKSDGTQQIYLRVTVNRKVCLIPLGIYLVAQDWNEKGLKVRPSYKNSTRINTLLAEKIAKAERALIENEEEIYDYSTKEIRNLIEYSINQTKYEAQRQINGVMLYEYNEVIIARFQKAKKYATAKTYKSDMLSVKKFMNDEDIPMKKIDYKWLVEFETYCYSRGVKINGVNHYMRTLRSLFNKAIKDRVLNEKHYPFKQYTLKRVKTEKRAISKEEINRIRNFEAIENTDLWHAKNYLTFMFNMQGMNFIDICFLKYSNLHNDRIIYHRRKTKRIYNIKLSDEAKKIVGYYATEKPNATDYVFPLLPNGIDEKTEQVLTKYETALKKINANARILGQLCGISQPLTTYVIRHSWATIAKNLGVSTAIISEGLGHEDIATTQTYLDSFANGVIDDANSLIIS